MATEDDVSVTDAGAAVSGGGAVSKENEVKEEMREEKTVSTQEAAEAATPKMNLKAAFDMFDLDGSGQISAAEFGTVIRSLGENPTDEEVEALLKVNNLKL